MESIKIRQFGKQEIIILREEIQTALNNVKLKYGISELKLGSINFNTSEFTSKISGKIEDINTANYKNEEAKFFALRNGLPLDFMNSNFILDGSVFTITELVTSRHKYPITAHSNESGKTFKFTASRIKELLDKFKVIDISYQDVDFKILPK